jgi:hypothetical protein
MADLNRSHLIDMLGRLGDSDDATALAAARELSRTIKDANLTWDELLQSEDATVPDGRTPHEAPSVRMEARAGGAGHGDTARLIDRLLARTDISETLRTDLGDFRKQAAEGKLHKDDADYIRAVAKRLGS